MKHPGCSIDVVYDNRSLRGDLIADWGFSCLLRLGTQSILFDAGAKGDILTNNLTALYGAGSEIKGVNVFLSHDHFDHVGGVTSVLHSSSQTCYMPASSSPKLFKRVSSSGGRPVLIENKTELCPNIWSTGELGGSPREQALVVSSGGKLLLLTGCAHKGLVTIVEHVISHFKEAPYMVMGGFHWHESSEAEVEFHVKQLRQMGVQKVAPCHCTGDKAMAWIQKMWDDGFVTVGAGKRIYL